MPEARKGRETGTRRQSLSGDLRRGFGIGAGVIYGRMLGKYKRSPIVSDAGDASQLAAAIGLTYTF